MDCSRVYCSCSRLFPIPARDEAAGKKDNPNAIAAIQSTSVRYWPMMEAFPKPMESLVPVSWILLFAHMVRIRDSTTALTSTIRRREGDDQCLGFFKRGCRCQVGFIISLHLVGPPVYGVVLFSCDTISSSCAGSFTSNMTL